MNQLGLAVHVVVLASGLCTSYFWAPGWSPSAHSPLCPSPPIFFTALFPLLSTDLSAKCFPSLLTIFIPLSELFPLVNSFLAQGGQLSPGASLHCVGWRCGVDGHLKRGRNWQHGPCLVFGSCFLFWWQQVAAAAAARCSFIPHFNLLKPSLRRQHVLKQSSTGSQNSLEISSILFCFGLFKLARGGQKGSRAFSASRHTSLFTIRQMTPIPAMKSSSVAAPPATPSLKTSPTFPFVAAT